MEERAGGHRVKHVTWSMAIFQKARPGAVTGIVASIRLYLQTGRGDTLRSPAPSPPGACATASLASRRTCPCSHGPVGRAGSLRGRCGVPFVRDRRESEAAPAREDEKPLQVHLSATHGAQRGLGALQRGHRGAWRAPRGALHGGTGAHLARLHACDHLRKYISEQADDKASRDSAGAQHSSARGRCSGTTKRRPQPPLRAARVPRTGTNGP